VIGTVSAAEFFVTVMVSATFIAALVVEAFTAARVLPKRLLIAVGLVLTPTSAYGVFMGIG
jgi:uncharacterized protein